MSGVTQQSIVMDRRTIPERIACRVYLAANQENLVDTVWTKITLDTVSYDLGTNFNTALYKFTAPVGGLYAIRAKVDFTSTVANKNYATAIYVNGASVVHSHVHSGGGTAELDSFIYDELYLDKNDYIELYAQSNAGVDTVDIVGTSGDTFLGVRLITKEGTRQ